MGIILNVFKLSLGKLKKLLCMPDLLHSPPPLKRKLSVDIIKTHQSSAAC